MLFIQVVNEEDLSQEKGFHREKHWRFQVFYLLTIP